jgi:hypothetical protein
MRFSGLLIASGHAENRRDDTEKAEDTGRNGKRRNPVVKQSKINGARINPSLPFIGTSSGAVHGKVEAKLMISWKLMKC